MAHAIDDGERTEESKNRRECGESERMLPRKNTPQPTPPDGGWGWCVVFASFMIHIVTDGVTYSFGVFYVELLHYFGEGNGATAWIASILVGVTLCSGPISGSFVDKYGCRAVTIAGSILSCVCLLASVWAQNVATLYFTIGIGTGLGFGLIYLPAIVSVTCYFEKLRSLATGIAVCGSGLGTLVFAPFLQYLIASYGWRGAMMIIAGIVLNCIIFGAMFRPLENKQSKECLPSKEEPREMQVFSINETKETFNRPHSVSNVNIKYITCDIKTQTTNNIRIAVSQPILINKSGYHHREAAFKNFETGIMDRRDIFYQGSMENIRKRSKSFCETEQNMCLNTSLKSLPNGTVHKSVENFKCLPYAEKKLNILHKMLGLSLLKDPVYILFIISNFCTSIGFNIPYIYLLPQATEQGISEDISSYLLAVIGIANTAGRVVLGYVSDKPWINRLLVYNLCLTVCGVATLFSTFCSTFTAFTFYATVYGFTAGAYVGLTSVILVDLLGLDQLTNGFGLLLLFQGFASFLGPPIAGWLYDALRSYDPGFYVAGSMIAISGIMLFAIPPVQRRLQQKADKLRQIEELT